MSLQVKILIFIVVSAALVRLTRFSWREIRSHGFYRFFAFEAIIVLVLLNLDCWFCEPLATHQAVSWILLIISLLLVIHAYQMLRKMGKPDSSRNDPSLVGIEKTTDLVTVGAYRYIRHPMYASLLSGAWGVFFKQPAWIGAALAVIATFFLILTARAEEAENRRYFGAAYRSYMKRTKMFIPYLF